MSDIAFVLGNGESRKGILIDDLKKKGTVFACNGVYRTEKPDYLITWLQLIQKCCLKFQNQII